VNISGPAIKAFGLQLALLIGLLALWQWAAQTFPGPSLPPIPSVARVYWRLIQGDLFDTTVLPSLRRMCLGFGIAVLAGTMIGLVIGYFRSIDPWIRPVLEYLRFIPAIAVLPPALLLLGPTDTMRVFVIAFGCVFPVLLAAIDGARRVDPTLLDVARVSGLGAVARVTRVVLFAALPPIFAGIRVALGLGLIMMVISELTAADDGIGFFILRSQRLFQSAGVYAGVLVIGTVGWVLTAGLLGLEKRTLRWHRGSHGIPTAGVGA
jgi:ABC-type nitrate/sulfonate/bicarbonate transport system permease component